MSNEQQCPFPHKTAGRSNRDWWPNQLNLKALHQHPRTGDPMDAGYDYATEFLSLDLDALIPFARWMPADAAVARSP